MPPGVDEVTAFRATGRAARNIPGCAALLDHLRDHPDALISGSAQAPPSLIRLAHALAAAGVPGVVLPGCAGCGKVTADLRSWPGAGLTCQNCYQDARRQPCTNCGTTGRVAARGPAGPVCGRCYQRDPARHEECAACHQVRRVAYRDADGRPWCAPCYPRPRKHCTICGQEGRITAIAADGPVCGRCYRRPARRCGRCGQIRQIQVRAREGVPDLCAACYRGPDDPCGRCGQLRPRKGYRDGKPICGSCYKPPPDRCRFCGQVAPITARWESGPVCVSCYPKVRAIPVPCPSCRKPRVLTHLGQDGQAICGPCAGQPGRYLCGRCGGPADCLVRGLCSRCALDARVSELLGEHDAGRLAAIGQALRGAGNPKCVLTWLSRSSSARLLADLARHDGPLTHELIDAYPRGQARSQIRQALVHGGVLPPRDERIEDVGAWLGDQLRDVPRHHARWSRRSAAGWCCAGPATAPGPAPSPKDPDHGRASRSGSPWTSSPGSTTAAPGSPRSPSLTSTHGSPAGLPSVTPSGTSCAALTTTGWPNPSSSRCGSPRTQTRPSPKPSAGISSSAACAMCPCRFTFASSAACCCSTAIPSAAPLR